MKSIVVKHGLHLSSELPQSREKLKEIWVEICLGGSFSVKETFCRVQELLWVEIQGVQDGVGHVGNRGGDGGQGEGGTLDEVVLWRVLW